MDILIIIPGWITKYIIDKEHSVSEYYENILPFFEKEKRGIKKIGVKIIKFPGFGQNSQLDNPWHLDDFVKYLNEYISNLSRIDLNDSQINVKDNQKFSINSNSFDSNSRDEIYILGHSFGGQVAAKFAYLYPEKVKKLILYNAACLRKSQITNNKLKTSIKNFTKSIGRIIFNVFPLLRKIFYKIFIGHTNYAKLSDVMRKTMSNVLSEDLTEILPKIETKTLILWGNSDNITPLIQGLKIKNLIPNSKIVIHPGGHSFHLQDPQTFAEYVKNFLT